MSALSEARRGTRHGGHFQTAQEHGAEPSLEPFPVTGCTTGSAELSCGGQAWALNPYGLQTDCTLEGELRYRENPEIVSFNVGALPGCHCAGLRLLPTRARAALGGGRAGSGGDIRSAPGGLLPLPQAEEACRRPCGAIPERTLQGRGAACRAARAILGRVLSAAVYPIRREIEESLREKIEKYIWNSTLEKPELKWMEKYRK